MQGHIRARGKGTWAIVIERGRDAAGHRQQQWSTVHGTKKEAEAERTRILHEIDAGTFIEPSKTTVGGFLDTWLRDYAKTAVTNRTFDVYEQTIRLYLKPALGALLLPKLTPLHIQGLYAAAMQEGGRTRGEGGLAPRTVQRIHRVLRQALSHAVEWGLLVRNPADSVKRPRAPQVDMRCLDDDETGRLLAATQGDPLHMLTLLAVTTGLRRGELLALRWQDLALDAATPALAVSRTLERTGKAGVAFKEPKTKRSRRTVTLADVTTDGLRRHRVEQGQVGLLLGRGLTPGDLIFARPDGKPYDPARTTTRFQALAKKAGLGHVRLHDLRHTHATTLLRAGVPVNVVSERLGHSSAAMTLDVYGHVLSGMQEDAAKRTDAIMRAALGKASARA